jgi:hypothetical protein
LLGKLLLGWLEEEHYLARDLSAYQDYCRTVRHNRVLPGVW